MDRNEIKSNQTKLSSMKRSEKKLKGTNWNETKLN